MSEFRSLFRTDLASEQLKPSARNIDKHVARTDVILDAQAAERLKKAPGRYTTIASPVVARGDREHYDRLINALTDAIKEYVGSAADCMVVGLGNPSMTADALGNAVVKRIRVTRGLDETKRSVCTLLPNVLGVTGIESFDIVKGAVERVKPDLLIVVDSLCAAASERLASAFQISDSGITPGSGVSNFRFRIDRESMGSKVVTVGVPLVVYAATLVREAAGENAAEFSDELIVTPKDIDIIVEECALVIASAINGALS